MARVGALVAGRLADASIDGAMTKLERVVRRHKERTHDRNHAGSGDAMDGFVSADASEDFEA